LTAEEGCGCNDKVKQMDAWGIAGTEKHKEEIVQWLQEQRDKQGWAAVLKAGAKAVLTGIALDPFDQLGSLVELAIQRAREKS